MTPCCNPSPFPEAMPEEPPPLAVGPAPSLSSFLHRPRVVAQRRKPFRVGPSELRQSETGNEGDRALEVPGVSVLDDLLELPPQGRWQLHRPRLGFARDPHERSYRIGAGREPVGPLELVEERLLLGGEAHSKESSRGRVGSGVPHVFNTNLTDIYVLCNFVKHRGASPPTNPASCLKDTRPRTRLPACPARGWRGRSPGWAGGQRARAGL